MNVGGYKAPEWDAEAFAKESIEILHNMALAHEAPRWRRWLRRLDWHISAEPLRYDACSLLRKWAKHGEFSRGICYRGRSD